MKISETDILLKAAFTKRLALFGDPETDCFRIFNSSGDGIRGLTLDWYNGYILIQYYTSGAQSMIDQIVARIVRCASLFPEPVRGILLKNRMHAPEQGGSGKWKSLIVWGAYPEGGNVVRQNGTLMNTDLVNGQNTGIFLDMRDIRAGLADFYKREKPGSMLNLFCYTGAFSAHALKNGVERAINVDLSKSVLKRAVENYRLNGLTVDERNFVYGDSSERVKIFAKKNRYFDFVVFDPPTFSRNKGKNFSVRHNYTAFLDLIGQIVPRGFVFTSINALSLSKTEYLSFHPRSWELVMFANESTDFIHRGDPYLKAGLWKI